MRIISFNANGIRSAANKGFFDWLRQQDADVTCLQETKAQEDQLLDPMFRPDGHHCFYKDASTKKGYSGVAIYSRREPDEVRTALGWAPFDDEGRYVEARFGNLSVVSFYIPSGSSGDIRQGFKFEVMDWLRPILDEWPNSRRDYVLCTEHRAQRPRHQNWKSTRRIPGCFPPNDWLNGALTDRRSGCRHLS
jgi:exodeoxyribonuclease-3